MEQDPFAPKKETSPDAGRESLEVDPATGMVLTPEESRDRIERNKNDGWREQD